MRRTGTIPELLEYWAGERPNRRFLQVGEEFKTFAEVHHDAGIVAAALSDRGVQRGDRVAIMTPTSLELFSCLFGVATLGAISVPLNIFLKGKPLAHQLADSGCTVLVTDGPGLELVRPLLPELPALRLIITVGLEDDAVPVESHAVTAFDQLIGSTAVALPRADITWSDTFAILYTSGTTGLPKGCVISHGLTVHWSRFTDELAGLTDEDVIFTAAPPFHVGGQTPVIGALAMGIAAVVEPGFSASGYLARVKATGATVAVGVGWIAQALLKQPVDVADRDHTLRAMSTVQLSVPEQEAFRDRFGIEALTQQYGQTECYPISYSVFADRAITPYAGAPTRQLHVALLDDEGCEVGAGEVGEICIRPLEPYVMFDGYWNDAERTLEACRGLWLHTGDVGRLVDGQLLYVDRKKDSMRRRGENVSAFELERTILQHPDIFKVAVHAVRIEGEIDGEIKACVVLQPGTAFDVEDLAGYMARELPYFAVPRFVEVVSELPTNASGRVMKDDLRALGVTATTLDLVAMGLGVSKDDRRTVRS